MILRGSPMLAENFTILIDVGKSMIADLQRVPWQEFRAYAAKLPPDSEESKVVRKMWAMYLESN